jgi:DinB family protein
MMHTTLTGTAGTALAMRIIGEGYGTGAWHGPDLKAALGDVTSDVAFWRPGPDRHNIAEIAMHHACCVRNVRAKLAGVDAEPFVLDGDDWFALPDPSRLSWPAVLDVVDREQQHLSALAADIDTGRVQSALSDTERFDLVIGITCHAVYHAGQVQLIKKLKTAA